MADLISQPSTITVTSLELVAMINEHRKEVAANGGKQFVELRHETLLTKVPMVLKKAAQNFLRSYLHPINGASMPMYSFPKREACLMVMSYDYDIQAKVYDRMTNLELESATKDNEIAQLRLEAATAAAKTELHATAVQLFKDYYTKYLSNNPQTPLYLAQSEAAKHVLRTTGIDLTGTVTKTPGMVVLDKGWASPSQLARICGYRHPDFKALGKAMNEQLRKKGLQRRSETPDERLQGRFVATELGKPYSNSHAWTGTASEGFNLKWSQDVIKAFDLPTVDEFKDPIDAYDPSVDGDDEAAHWAYVQIAKRSAEILAARIAWESRITN